MKRIISFILIIALSFAFLAGCGEESSSGGLVTDINPSPKKTIAPVESESLTKTEKPIETEKPQTTEKPEESAKPIIDASKIQSKKGDAADFAVRLFKQSVQGNDGKKNTLISPISVLCALAMTVNGADGETLKQIESAIGMSKDELNKFLYSYIESLPQSEKHKLSLANSIWFKDDETFTVNQNFLNINQEYYGAEIREVPFNDTALNDINKWVNDKTDGMIPSILDKISDDAVMYLINALAFDAEWADIYTEEQVRNGIFTCEDGTQKGVEFMHGEEGKYIENSSATGFIKYYKDSSYAFVAMLPKDGVSVSEVIDGLDGESLSELISGASHESVRTAIPKFETEYSVEMKDILKQMGIMDAFDSGNADFTNLGKSQRGNIYINRVLHKTHIAVDERGTKAGAATVVEILPESAPMEPKDVYLTRPFVYMIVDCENDLPVFMGTMKDVG